jgi:hypothetical protein
MGTFGETGTGDTSDDCGLNAKQGSRWQAPETGTITNISYYCWINMGTPVFKAVVYSDTAGSPPQPNALLATSAEGTPGAGAAWVDVAISCAITSGAYYWIGIIVGDGGTDKINDKLQSNAGNVNYIRYDASDTYSDGASDPWGASDYSDGGAHLCIHADYSLPASGIQKFTLINMMEY